MTSGFSHKQGCLITCLLRGAPARAAARPRGRLLARPWRGRLRSHGALVRSFGAYMYSGRLDVSFSGNSFRSYFCCFIFFVGDTFLLLLCHVFRRHDTWVVCPFEYFCVFWSFAFWFDVFAILRHFHMSVFLVIHSLLSLLLHVWFSVLSIFYFISVWIVFFTLISSDILLIDIHTLSLHIYFNMFMCMVFWS